MSSQARAPLWKVPVTQLEAGLPGFREIVGLLGIDCRRGDQWIERLPFAEGDVTAGTETELQVAVIGRERDVDLPRKIKESSYYANVSRRSRAGDMPRRALTSLERVLEDNEDGVWENSWVRIPIRLLNERARSLLDGDFRANRADPRSAPRSDVARFRVIERGEEGVRLPASYVLRLALADALGELSDLDSGSRAAGEGMLECFLSDNTSPETLSFHVSPLGRASNGGRAVARENQFRYLVTQFLAAYANEKFGLRSSGQKLVVYLSPNPARRQKALNDCVSETFYRELFMNPCLAGWDRGEDKHAYMCLCHEVLTRSHLHGVAKLREAGIINRGLIAFPSLSNASLANNGTHLSLGSRVLTNLCARGDVFGLRHEKLAGDLVIKFVEHFLPLFVGTYSAAPWRVDFADFAPEKLLGFLAHELDFSHLRMLWRRWKKKAGVCALGHRMTPTGMPWLDRAMSAVFRMRGDCVPDFRLIDYLASLLSTEESPALNGRPGNTDRLKRDLASLGVFDERMSMYLLYRMRQQSVAGYSGFEGRFYSLFADIEADLGDAAELQRLVTLLAWKLIAQGRLTHDDIPDGPEVESERRQVFFGRAVGVPTFFVRRTTPNRLLLTILSKTKGVRDSHRYPGWRRVEAQAWMRSLVEFIEREGADLVEMTDSRGMLERLKERLTDGSGRSTREQLMHGILRETNASNPMSLNSREFATGAERFYRDTLRVRHVVAGLERFELSFLEARANLAATGGKHDDSALRWIAEAKAVRSLEELGVAGLTSLLQSGLAVASWEARRAGELIAGGADVESSVHRTADGLCSS